MPKLQTDSSKFSLNNALCMAMAAKFAYEGATAARRGLIDTLGFDDARFIDIGDTQVVIGRRADAILSAFRGTQQIKDWLTNIDTKLVKGPPGRVHQGFGAALADAWPRIRLVLDKYRDGGQRLWFTGHSLGGALAMLATAAFIQEPGVVGGLYTYGQPRVGDADFVREFDAAFGDRAFRFVNNNDIVPRVPPRAKGYEDTKGFRYFSVFGQMYDDPKTWQMYLDSLAGAAPTALTRYNELALMLAKNWLADGIADHSLDRYIELIRQAK